MKSLLLTLLALMIFCPAAARAQELHPTFAFSRQADDSGAVDYVLEPVAAELGKKFGTDKPFQILGAVARVENGLAVLVFANAQKGPQLSTQSNKSVIITADAAEIKRPEYELAGQDDDATHAVRLEIANVLISFKDLQKILKAQSVTVKFGAVTYQLDKDNLDALHYMGAEIEKDQKKSK